LLIEPLKRKAISRGRRWIAPIFQVARWTRVVTTSPNDAEADSLTACATDIGRYMTISSYGIIYEAHLFCMGAGADRKDGGASRGPEGVETITDLVRWLKAQSEEREYAFGNENAVRAAIDHVHVKPSARIVGANEIAFFPPMTGG